MGKNHKKIFLLLKTFKFNLGGSLNIAWFALSILFFESNVLADAKYIPIDAKKGIYTCEGDGCFFEKIYNGGDPLKIFSTDNMFPETYRMPSVVKKLTIQKKSPNCTYEGEFNFKHVKGNALKDGEQRARLKCNDGDYNYFSRFYKNDLPEGTFVAIHKSNDEIIEQEGQIQIVKYLVGIKGHQRYVEESRPTGIWKMSVSFADSTFETIFNVTKEFKSYKNGKLIASCILKKNIVCEGFDAKGQKRLEFEYKDSKESPYLFAYWDYVTKYLDDHRFYNGFFFINMGWPISVVHEPLIFNLNYIYFDEELKRVNEYGNPSWSLHDCYNAKEDNCFLYFQTYYENGDTFFQHYSKPNLFSWKIYNRQKILLHDETSNYVKDFFDDGTIKRETILKNGSIKNKKEYFPNGKLKHEAKEDFKYNWYYCENGSLAAKPNIKDKSSYGEIRSYTCSDESIVADPMECTCGGIEYRYIYNPPQTGNMLSDVIPPKVREYLQEKNKDAKENVVDTLVEKQDEDSQDIEDSIPSVKIGNQVWMSKNLNKK